MTAQQPTDVPDVDAVLPPGAIGDGMTSEPERDPAPTSTEPTALVAGRRRFLGAFRPPRSIAEMTDDELDAYAAHLADAFAAAASKATEEKK